MRLVEALRAFLDFLMSGRAGPTPVPAPPVAIPVTTPGMQGEATKVTPKPDRFLACHAVTAHHEGGWSDHPADPGGATMFGITIGTLSDWRGQPVTPAEVRALTKAEALAIYRSRYWAAVRADDLFAGLDLAVYDWAVNAGPGRAVRGLQGLLDVPVDGGIGPVTLAAVRAVHPSNRRHLVGALCDARLAHLRGLATWETFRRGWTERVNDVRAKALAAVR